MGRAYGFHDVGQFHHKFGLANSTYQEAGPKEIDTDLAIFRAKFLCEELQEFFEGMGMTFKTPLYDIMVANVDWNKEKSHEQMFDALIDLVYVAYGTAHLFGYPWEEGWNEVQRANMLKQRAASAEESEAGTGRGSALDVIKPPGWTAPNIRQILIAAGFKL